MSLSDARLRAARAAIASACLDSLPDATLGSVQLRDDQRRIVARAARAIEHQGGCLIGEDVGRGKTFVALALARRWNHPLVIAPASLRSTWRVAMERAAVSCAFISHEALSRGGGPTQPFDGIIVDESHHFRTTTTRRTAALALLAARAPVVLMSATPLQNRARDLAAQIALFHGEQAFSLDASALARFVIRSDDAVDAAMPTVLAPEWLRIDADDGLVLRAILDLPPPARPLDGGDAGALRAIGLVRAWGSSRAALQNALRSRRRVATAIAQGVDEGRSPTRQEARAWHAAEGVVQLGFPAMLMRGEPDDRSLAELRAALDDDERAMDRLAETLRAVPDPDVARVHAIRNLRTRHSESRIIAFSEFATTVAALFGAMRSDAGVGMLTAREARIASGRIGRDELLARFAPLAQHATPSPPHESVTLLLATDLLSEGVNLQDASIVLHLDLPWNPARLAQRVGRVRRPGGSAEVKAYLLAPPASAAELLDTEARLRRKLAQAQRVIGADFPVMPVLGVAHPATRGSDEHGELRTSATATGAFLRRLERWKAECSRAPSSDRCMVAGVHAPFVGWLAALSDGRVLGDAGAGTSDGIRLAGQLAEQADGSSRPVRADEVRSAMLALRGSLASEVLGDTCGIAASVGPLRRTVLDWLASVAMSGHRHERAATLAVIGRLRDRLQHPLPLGTEQRLVESVRCCRGRGGNAAAALAELLRIVDEAPPRRLEEHGTATPVAMMLFSPAAFPWPSPIQTAPSGGPSSDGAARLPAPT